MPENVNIDRIIVTTDSNNIISKIKNINVTLRLREKTCRRSSAYEVILDVLENIIISMIILFIYPTSPLRNRYDLNLR